MMVCINCGKKAYVPEGMVILNANPDHLCDNCMFEHFPEEVHNINDLIVDAEVVQAILDTVELVNSNK